MDMDDDRFAHVMHEIFVQAQYNMMTGLRPRLTNGSQQPARKKARFLRALPPPPNKFRITSQFRRLPSDLISSLRVARGPSWQTKRGAKPWFEQVYVAGCLCYADNYADNCGDESNDDGDDIGADGYAYETEAYGDHNIMSKAMPSRQRRRRRES
jgi:hypothetical protein